MVITDEILEVRLGLAEAGADPESGWDAVEVPWETVSDVFAAHRPAWMADAACRERPELSWFEESDAEAARAVCAGCLVLEECRDYAAAGREPHGLWAGLTPAERAALRPKPTTCQTCGRAARRMVGGTCIACYSYRRRTGRDRPEELIRRAG